MHSVSQFQSHVQSCAECYEVHLLVHMQIIMPKQQTDYSNARKSDTLQNNGVCCNEHLFHICTNMAEIIWPILPQCLKMCHKVITVCRLVMW